MAIIAAERGLNAQSRLKLESLAKHQKLPNDLFAEAIRQLQGDEAKIPKLNRYEQEFVNYLAKEFKKVRSGIISLRMEQNAIELADKKFQIPPIRAEWLIDQQAKLASIGRISRGEAEEYAAQFIAERIGARRELEPELRDEIYERSHKLGLTRNRVDAEILRLLNINRFGDRPQSRNKWWMVGLLLLALIGLGAGGYAAGWLPVSFRQPIDIPSEPPPVKAPEPERPTPGWMSESTKELISRVANTETQSPGLVSNLLSEDPVQRKSGYQQLTSMICQKTSTQHKQVEDLICQLYFEEPDQSVAFELIETTCRFVRIPDDSLPVSSEVFERQYRANRLLGLIYYFVPANVEMGFSDGQTDRSERKQLLVERINSVTGIDPVNLVLPEFVTQSERGISVDQWNYLIQNNWESPSRAALLVQPLYDLTRSRLASDALNRFCFRLLQSILESDDRQWLQLQRPIRETVSAADEVELIEWIELFEASTSMAFREFVGPKLVEKAKVESPSTRLADVSAALKRFVASYKNRILQPFLVRNERLENATADLLENLAINDRYTPDQIAQVAFTTNANLAFCQQIQNNEIGTDGEFLKIDEILALPKIRLRELVSLPGKSAKRPVGADPTASDIRRKNKALGKIRNLSTESPGTRINALRDLEKIALRFDDLAYGEAEILARYFLADLADEEMLNIQRVISAFADWPSLGLALADQISQGNLSLDRALTLARLMFNAEFEVRLRDENWPENLQKQMIQAVVDRVEIHLEQNSAGVQSDWDRLELFLADVYRERFELIADESVNSVLIGPTVQPSEILFSTLEHQLRRQSGSAETVRRIRRSKNLIRLGSYNEMEKTIVANQLLFELLTLIEGELSADQAAALKELSARFESQFDSSTGLVEQLCAVNYALLQVSALKRSVLAERIIKE